MSANPEKILIVDDEPNLLVGIQRNLRNEFNFITASSGPDALAKLKAEPDIAVLMSDLRMPGMDGVQLLKSARLVAPNCVRLMLSGNADLDDTVAAVNEGYVFRFLSKPCEMRLLQQMLTASLEQHRLIMAEKTLLEKTLQGSLQVLIEILSLVDSEAFGKSEKVRSVVRLVCRELQIDPWPVEVAALLGRISIVTLPPDLLIRYHSGQELTPVERDVCIRLPQVSASLLAHIPRMEAVSEIILYDQKNYNGSGYPSDNRAGDAIPLGSRILKAVREFLKSAESGNSLLQSIELISIASEYYDPKVVDVIRKVLPELEMGALRRTNTIIKISNIKELSVGQLILSPIITTTGVLIVREGQIIQSPLLQKIRNFAQLHELKMPILVEQS